MKRSAVLGTLLGALGGVPAWAQQAGRTYRVDILSGKTFARDYPSLAALRRTLSGLGYQEGKNLVIVYRTSRGDYEQDPALVAEILRAKPDVIVAAGPPAIAAAKHAARSVPIVVTDDSDPVGSGFIASLARPGGNITGVSTMDIELVGKRLQLLKELVPRLRRVAVILNPSNPGNLTQWRQADSVARTLALQAVAVDIRSPEQIEAALKRPLHVDGILVFPDGVTQSKAVQVVQLVAAQRLPAIYPLAVFTAAGGLLSYGASQIADWSRAATYVDRILKGANPADLPVERPTVFDLVVNLKTARTLGITVPQSILLQATQVIR